MAALPYPGSLLAVDMGRSRIGLAISDGLQISATPLPILQVKNLPEARILEEIRALARDRAVVGILVGRPISLRGHSNETLKWIEDFIQKLSHNLDIPIVFQDERFTSVEAENLIREKGYGWKKKKEILDSIAASLILESYLHGRTMER